VTFAEQGTSLKPIRNKLRYDSIEFGKAARTDALGGGYEHDAQLVSSEIGVEYSHGVMSYLLSMTNTFYAKTTRHSFFIFP
jgi:hypothetical protein